MIVTAEYDLRHYGQMVADEHRFAAYREALQKSINHGSVVVDIGSGPGFFALYALRLGASTVYAVDPNTSIQLARKFAEANGYGDTIQCIQATSFDLDLPRRADVIVSDLRGIIPLLGQHIPSIIDARKRLLAPNGVLIPQSDTLWCALVENRKHHDSCVIPWCEDFHGLNLTKGYPYVINRPSHIRAEAGQMLSAPSRWGQLDYQTISGPDLHGQVGWTMEREGVAHGMALWFDTELVDGVGYSNAPGSPVTTYGQYYFPFEHPLTLGVGDKVDVSLSAVLIAGQYVWRWVTHSVPALESPRPTIDYDQSTFKAELVDPASLRLRNPSVCPQLGVEGATDSYILSLMKGELSVGQIARLVFELYPNTYPDVESLQKRVGDLSVKYARR